MSKFRTGDEVYVTCFSVDKHYVNETAIVLASVFDGWLEICSIQIVSDGAQLSVVASSLPERK